MKTIIYFIMGIIFLIAIPILSILDVFKGFFQPWIGLLCLLGFIFIVLGFKTIKQDPVLDEQTIRELDKMGETEDYPRR